MRNFLRFTQFVCRLYDYVPRPILLADLRVNRFFLEIVVNIARRVVGADAERLGALYRDLYQFLEDGLRSGRKYSSLYDEVMNDWLPRHSGFRITVTTADLAAIPQ